MAQIEPSDHDALVTSLLFVMNGRKLEDVCKALVQVVGDDDWHLLRILSDEIRCCVLSSTSPDELRERISDFGDNQDEECSADDDELFHRLCTMHIPDSWGETISYCMDDLIEELRKEGKIYPRWWGECGARKPLVTTGGHPRWNAESNGCP